MTGRCGRTWCAEGPEITRRSTPRWFKEIDEWFQLSVAQAKGQRKELEQLRQDLAGYDLGAWVTYWGLDNKTFHALNPDRFPFTPADEAVMKFLKENRIRPDGLPAMHRLEQRQPQLPESP